MTEQYINKQYFEMNRLGIIHFMAERMTDFWISEIGTALFGDPLARMHEELAAGHPTSLAELSAELLIGEQLSDNPAKYKISIIRTEIFDTIKVALEENIPESFGMNMDKNDGHSGSHGQFSISTDYSPAKCLIGEILDRHEIYPGILHDKTGTNMSYTYHRDGIKLYFSDGKSLEKAQEFIEKFDKWRTARIKSGNPVPTLTEQEWRAKKLAAARIHAQTTFGKVIQDKYGPDYSWLPALQDVMQAAKIAGDISEINIDETPSEGDPIETKGFREIGIERTQYDEMLRRTYSRSAQKLYREALRDEQGGRFEFDYMISARINIKNAGGFAVVGIDESTFNGDFLRLCRKGARRQMQIAQDNKDRGNHYESWIARAAQAIEAIGGLARAEIADSEWIAVAGKPFSVTLRDLKNKASYENYFARLAL